MVNCLMVPNNNPWSYTHGNGLTLTNKHSFFVKKGFPWDYAYRNILYDPYIKIKH